MFSKGVEKGSHLKGKRVDPSEVGWGWGMGEGSGCGGRTKSLLGVD